MAADDAFKTTLMGGILNAGWPSSGVHNLVRFSSRVESVGPGGRITLERKLPWEVKTQWGPAVHAVAPNTREVGLESMTFEFKWTR